MKESALDNLEKLIPFLTTSTVNKAYLDTLSAGNSILEIIDSAIYEVFAVGSKIT